MSSPKTKPFRNNRRSGISLVEILVAIAISSVLLGIVSMALVAMYDISRSLKDAGSTPWGTPQLVEQLRQDIASSTEANWNEQTGQLSLSLDKSPTVSYLFAESLCTRSLVDTNGEATEQRFKLTEAVTTTVEPKQANANDLLRITLTPTVEAKQSTRFMAMNELLVLVGRSHHQSLNLPIDDSPDRPSEETTTETAPTQEEDE